MKDRLGRFDLLLLVFALASGALFFSTLDRLWPLAQIDLNVSPQRLERVARQFLAQQDVALADAVAASRLELHDEVLEYVVRHFGRARAQQLIREGKPIYRYAVYLKKRDDPETYWVTIHPTAGVIGWGRSMQEDASGAVVDVDAARSTASAAVAAAIGLRVEELQETGVIERDRPSRRDHNFVYERYVSRQPELRERVTLQVSGNRLVGVHRALVLPESARRDARRRQAPTIALQMIGLVLVAIAGVGALVVFLSRLQQGSVRLAPAARAVVIIALFFLATQALRHADLLLSWDPLWPRWIATFQSLGESMAQGAWIAFALFFVVAAGDALDRDRGGSKGESFWRAAKGQLTDRTVGIASLRGFMIGLICGGVLAASILMLQWSARAWVGIQPQGFFFFALNSRMPVVSTLLYFLMVALVEEIGYRFFAGSWLMTLTRRKWIAIAVPGCLYGLTHTGLDFLPPVEPFWGRALALTLVGCVWGWAYFRYDALTVVLSHFTADLFIFNWPRLGSGDPLIVAKAVATIAVPLVPAVVLLLRPRRSSASQSDR